MRLKKEVGRMIKLVLLLAIVLCLVIYIASKDMKWHDIKHISWLFKEGIKDLFKFNLNGFIESYYLIKMHLKHNSKRL
jgi:hypothetical protein